MNANTRTNYICFVVALGGLLFGFDTAVISGVTDLVKNQFDLDTVSEGWLVSCGLLGSIAGVIATGAISDRLGRRKTTLLAGAMFLLSAIGCGLAPSFHWLIAARIAGGIGVGMASVTSPMYITEFAPAARRGRMVAYYQLAITLGILLAYLSNAALIHLAAPGTGQLLNEPWRGMLLVMSLPSLLFILLLLRVPESPRWLVAVGRSDEALRVLHTVRPPAVADKELEDIGKAHAKAAIQHTALLHPSLRIPLLIGIVLAILQQFSGINALIYYGPEIFRSAGLDNSNALLFQVVIGSVNLLATLIAIAYADRYGRKFLLKTGLTGMIIALGGCGFLFYTGHTQGWALLVLMLAYITCFAFSIGPVTWIIINEIFPTHVRARAVMVCTLALWGAVWLVGQFFPWLLDRVGAAFTFWAFALFSAINLIFSLTVVKETKGKTLEEMDTAFAAPH